MAAVWVIGSVNVDLVARVRRLPGPGETVTGRDFARSPGGKGANQAVAAAAAGAQVRLIGRVGADADGERYRAGLAERGVDVSGVLVQAQELTGYAIVVVDEQGENVIVSVPGANGRLDRSDLDRFRPAAGDVLLLQLEVPLDVVRAAVAQAVAHQVLVVLNPSPWAELEPDLWRRCDVVVVNEHEAAQLRAASGAPGSVIVTRGAAGADWGTVHAGTAAPVVVDTTGAGDAFTGALAAALSFGASRVDALAAAAAAGAAAVGRIGAQGWVF
jgi:ribokinase